MRAYNDIASLVTPAGTVGFNAASGDSFVIDPRRSTGLGMGRIRAPVDNRGQADGYIVHDFYEEGRHIVLAGLVRASTAAARDSMTDDLEDKLRSILREDGTLTFASASSLTVRCDLGADFPGGFVKDFIFGLVTASPTP